MKEKLLRFFMIICLVVFSFSFNVSVRVKPFNSGNVKRNIEILSSENYKGRLAGTFENEKAAYYIRDQFINNSLLPYDSNYFQTFDVNYPKKIDGKPYLKIIDKDGLTLKNFIYGKDYREDSLCFRRNRFIADKKSILSINDNSLIIGNSIEKFVLYCVDNNSVDFRSSYMYNSPYDMYVIVTKETLKEIKNSIDNGDSIICFIPFQTASGSIKNVTAYINGTEAFAPPVVIGAHFDHMGSDAGGNVFCGALDNASGTAFIIEMSKYLHSLGTPQRSIVFVAFNAEEYGLLGSKAFACKYSSNLQNSIVFNFDMIGSSNAQLNISGSKDDTSKSLLMNSASNRFDKEHIPFNYMFEDSSDHKSFRDKNINAITFIDNDMQRIHTTKDTFEYIDTSAIDRCYKIASKEIIKYAYNNNPLYTNYDGLMIISLLGTVLSFSKLIKGKGI